MRTAIYARYSSGRQRDASIDDQVRKCEQPAAAEAWQIVLRCNDEAISGSRSDRPGYVKVQKAALAS